MAIVSPSVSLISLSLIAAEIVTVLTAGFDCHSTEEFAKYLLGYTFSLFFQINFSFSDTQGIATHLCPLSGPANMPISLFFSFNKIQTNLIKPAIEKHLGLQFLASF